MKKRILLTGANGFIGQSFCESINRDLYDIYALDYQDAFYANSNKIKEYIKRDIQKPFHLDVEFDVIIHLAALNQTNINSGFTYEQFKEVNVVGTENVIKGCGFKKFILFSSSSIYEKKVEIIDESSPINPNSFYEKTKYEAELICKEYIDFQKLVVLRPVNVIGIKQANKALIPHFFSRAITNEPIEVFVPQNRRVQLLSVRDLLRALETIISIEDINGVYNLSGVDSMEVKSIAEKIIDICNSSSSVNCTNNTLEIFSKVVSYKAEQELKWCPQDSIDNIINDFAVAFLSDLKNNSKKE
jgi:nucleoside-diphosphate-sugar epimerase